MIVPTSLEAADAIRTHHTQLAGGLVERVAALHGAARQGVRFQGARDQVVSYLDEEIVPHALAEERTLYAAADTGPAAMLVDAMRAEHRDLLARLERLRTAADPISAVAGAAAIEALFLSHLAKENDRIVPALLAMPEVSLGELLAGMHELVG